MKNTDTLLDELSNLNNPNIWDQKSQIKTAVFDDNGFYLTPNEIEDIKDTAIDECINYKNQPDINITHINKFQKEVNLDVWKEWVMYNEGETRISNILNLFNELYNRGNLS
jgi:hypothetical protein